MDTEDAPTTELFVQKRPSFWDDWARNLDEGDPLITLISVGLFLIFWPVLFFGMAILGMLSWIFDKDPLPVTNKGGAGDSAIIGDPAMRV